MSPSILQIALLAIIQGFAELLPVSSSAHVIIAEKLMGLKPETPEMMFLLIMLHTGTMGAVVVYFWKAWEQNFFSSKVASKDVVFRIIIASAITAVVGMVLKIIVEAVVFHNKPGAAVEDLASNLYLMAASLAVAGILILSSASRSRAAPLSVPSESSDDPIPPGTAMMIGLSQGFCLPFRGLSRSATTISVGMLKGLPRRVAEEFSFALAVVITPPIIGREFLRLYGARSASHGTVHITPLVMPGLLGMALAFVAGLLALRWLSGWLEKGRWHYFGFYCFAAAVGVCVLATLGY